MLLEGPKCLFWGCQLASGTHVWFLPVDCIDENVADCWQKVELHNILCMMSEAISTFGVHLWESCSPQALEKLVLDVPECPGLLPAYQWLVQRRRAFMKKLLTVLSSRPSCCAMVSCISLLGLLFSLKMAISVRRCRSVNTKRCFFATVLRSFSCSCSFRLQAAEKTEGKGRCDHH